MLLYYLEVIKLSLSYKPLWDMLAEKGISKMEFAKSVEISNATLAKMGKDEAVSLTTIDKICNVYDCGIENIVKHLSTVTVDNNTSNELEIGTVIVSRTPISVGNDTNFYSNKYYHYVIIVKKQVESYVHEHTSFCEYLLAPLSYYPGNGIFHISVPNSRLNYFMSDTLYIRLDTIQTLTPDIVFQVVGTVPKSVIEKINKFVSFMIHLNISSE